MLEITVLSGKGGTGKTSISSALISIAKNAVVCDNDVDAADLFIILEPEVKETYNFDSGSIAKISENTCNSCGICMDNCRFDAIHINSEGKYEVNPFECEGCRLCERICPEKAIETFKNENNYWFVSDTRFGPFVHAKMGPGEENSGKLVTKVRQKAREIAKEIKADYIINDGPPGLGCTAISSVTGTDKVLLVIEPSLSGLHDARRLAELVKSFKVPVYAIINKYNINVEISDKVEEYLKAESIPLVGKIAFNRDFVKAMIERKSIIEYAPESEINMQVKLIWQNLIMS